jgi:hypothetical protein
MATRVPLTVWQTPFRVSPLRRVKLTWVPTVFPLQAAIASGGGPGGGLPFWPFCGGAGGFPDDDDDELLAAQAVAPPMSNARSSMATLRVRFSGMAQLH